jgi:hypothetical protein
MIAVDAYRPSSLLAAAAMLLAGCATLQSGDPQVLRTESVLRFSGDPAPLGEAEFVTITDSAGNTLFERAFPEDRQITVAAPTDGKLFISTRWTEGRTRQEINALESGIAPGGDVTLGLNETSRQYGIKTRSLAEVPMLGQALLGRNSARAAKPQPKGVTVTDGAGRILYTGPAADEIEVIATDGALVITTEWSHGEPTRQEISYTDSEVSSDEWDENARRPSDSTAIL